VEVAVEQAVRANIPFKRVSPHPELATTELWEECAALLRFWRRRCYYCFIPADAPNGESDWSIDHEHLSFALGKVRYYEGLLAKRELGSPMNLLKPEVLEVK
jgi:hypothetical protein